MTEKDNMAQVQKTKVQPVNKNASPEARELLEYVYSTSGTSIISGQHNFLGRMSIYTDSMYKVTGKYPAIWGGDFGFADSTHDIDNIKYRPLFIPEIKKQHERGAIITLTYHQANPTIGEPCQFKGGVISKLTDQQWQDLLTPGTPIYDSWKKQMDLFASYLIVLRDAHIPVLFRPYHEMNGGWFWWGKHPGEKGYKALWIQLYNYYTQHHKLNNLIWVWSPDKPSFGLKEYYPGDAYVDIVGCDIYPIKDTSVVFRQEWYNEILEIAKDRPMVLGEVGRMPSDEVLAMQPRWAWFMSWCDVPFKTSSIEEIKQVYISKKVITLDKLPKFK